MPVLVSQTATDETHNLIYASLNVHASAMNTLTRPRHTVSVQVATGLSQWTSGLSIIDGGVEASV